MIVIGAGYSGLLASCIIRDTTVYESDTHENCADKHQAVFRMKSNKIADHLGIEFKKVLVHKSIWFNGKNVLPTPNVIHQYSKKVSGKISDRSIGNIGTEIRYIPPDNFYNQLLAHSGTVHYSKKVNPFQDGNIKISTIPLSTIALIRGEEYPKFGLGPSISYRKIFVSRFVVKNCDSYCTIYYPDQDDDVYRATLNGDILIVESLKPLAKNQIELCEISHSLGLAENDIDFCTARNLEQPLGKITTIDEKLRSKFVLELTLKHSIYSLGRYATWRPKVMLDDVFDDIFVIRRLIEQGHYGSMLYNQNS